MEAVETVGNDLCFVRVFFLCLIKSAAEDPGHGKSADLLFILPVVPHGIPGEQNSDIRRILRIGIPAFGTLAERMYQTVGLHEQLILRLVQAGQKKRKEGRVIIERELSEPAVMFMQILAQATIIAAVQVNFPHPQLRFIDHNISKHSNQLCFINSVPHLGQRTMILPFPRGIRIFCLQCGQL